MKHLSLIEKRKKVELVLKYINVDCELDRLSREIPMIRRQLQALKRKNRKSEEYKRCRAIFQAKRRRKDNLLTKHKSLSMQFCLEYEINLELPETEKREIAHQVLFKNPFLFLDVQGGWARKAFNKMF